MAFVGEKGRTQLKVAKQGGKIVLGAVSTSTINEIVDNYQKLQPTSFAIPCPHPWLEKLNERVGDYHTDLLSFGAAPDIIPNS